MNSELARQRVEMVLNEIGCVGPLPLLESLWRRNTPFQATISVKLFHFIDDDPWQVILHANIGNRFTKFGFEDLHKFKPFLVEAFGVDVLLAEVLLDKFGLA
jgi:hypothetical protein